MTEIIAIEKLVENPNNPNIMSKTNFKKLVQNIKKTGLYEPIVVRPAAGKEGCFEIINGHHRCKALGLLGYESAECVVWNVDDQQAEIFLMTLNRLGGTDRVDKKIALLKNLAQKNDLKSLAKILPQKASQIEKLINLKLPEKPFDIKAEMFASAMVFFVSESQKQIIEAAIKKVQFDGEKLTKAQRASLALTRMAEHFLETNTNNSISS